MRTFFFLFAFLILGSFNAQGNLQFNQALVLESSAQTCTACWTVPAGKVWKVEQFSSNSDQPLLFYVNNKQLAYMNGYAYSTNSTSYYGARWGINFPFWLPANATLGFGGMESSKNISFFVLEFNIVP